MLRSIRRREFVGAGRFIHQRQYILDHQPRLVSPDWKVVPVGRYFLSHCPMLEVRPTKDAEGRQWLLLGYAFQADPTRADPCVAVGAASGLKQILDVVFSWAGRWLLISESYLIADAGGVMPAFYLPELSSAKLPAISSSLAILFECYELEIETTETLGWYVYEFFPPPTTRLKGVLKLLPDQIANLERGSIDHASRLELRRYRDLTADQRADRLLQSLSHIFKQMGASGNRIVIAATAGRDSRVAVAAAQHAGIAFETMNFSHWAVSSADRIITAQYSADLGIPYHNVTLGRRWSRDRRDAHDYHTFGSIAQANRMIFARGGYDTFDESVWFIRSGMFEIGRAFLWSKLKGVRWEDYIADPAPAVRSFHHFAGYRRILKGVRAWIAWRREHQEDADWRDVLYRDHRSCGYWSSVEQGLDLTRPRSILYFCSDLLFSLVMSATDEEKRNSTIQALVVEKSGTGLDKYPYNPAMDSRIKRAAYRAHKILLYALNEASNFARRAFLP
jgi:hypothetical protein